MDPPANFNGLRRKRYEEDPFVTFTIPDRKLTFDRLFEADSLEEFKTSMQSRARLGPNVQYDLIHTRDGDEVFIEDDQDFKAFAASTRYYHHSRVRVHITSGPANFTSTSVGGSVTAASDDNAREGGPPAKKRRIQGPKASIDLSASSAAPVPNMGAPAQEKPKSRRKPVSKAVPASNPPATDPSAPTAAGTTAPVGDASAPAPAPKRTKKKADAGTTNNAEAQPQGAEKPTPATDKPAAASEVAVKVGPPAKKPRKSTSKKVDTESTTNPPPASESQPVARPATSGGNTKKAAPKTPATLPSPTPSPSPEDDEDASPNTTNRKESEKASKKTAAPATARARSASSASNTSSVHPEDEAAAHEVQLAKPKAATKSKATAAKDEAASKPKSRAKTAAKPTATVEGDGAGKQQSTEVPPKKKRTAKPKSATAEQDAEAAEDVAEAPAKPKAVRAPKSKAVPPSEDQDPRPEEDQAEAPAKADQKPTRKRKKDATQAEGEASQASKPAATDAPAAKKPRKSTKPPTAPCRICLSHETHSWFECPLILACITPPQNDDDRKALDEALPQVSKRLAELEEEQSGEPKHETADLISSIQTSIKMAKANQLGEPLVDEEDASKKKKALAKKKNGGDPSTTGEKEKGDGKKTSEVLPTSVSTRVRESGPNAVPPSLSPTATATELPGNATPAASSANNNSRLGQADEVVTEGHAGQEGRGGKGKKAKSVEKAKNPVAKLPAKEASRRAESPAKVGPLASTHVASENPINSSTTVNAVSVPLAPEPRWSPSPELAPAPNKDGGVTAIEKNKSHKVAGQKNAHKEPTTADTPQSTATSASKRTRPAKPLESSSTGAKRLSYIDAFSPSGEESNIDDSDDDVEMKNAGPSSTKLKSKARTFTSPSPPPDLTPSKLKTVSKSAAPTVLRPRQATESESEDNSDRDIRRTNRTDGPPTIASSGKQGQMIARGGAGRAMSPLRRAHSPAKGRVPDQEILVPGTPGQDGSSDEESSQEEEEEQPAPQATGRGQAMTTIKGNPNVASAPQPASKTALTPKPSVAQPLKASGQGQVLRKQAGRKVESSESDSSKSSDSEDERAVLETVRQSTKGSTTSDSSNSSKDAPAVDARQTPFIMKPSASQSAMPLASRTPMQKSFPSLQSLSSQPRRTAYRAPNFLSQPRRQESSQVQQQSDSDDSSNDDSSDDDEVPKDRRAGAGAPAIQRKRSRLDAWSQS